MRERVYDEYEYDESFAVCRTLQYTLMVQHTAVYLNDAAQRSDV